MLNIIPEFILGGDATFTVSNGKGHYTYHIYRAKETAEYPHPGYFAKLLCGPDNTNPDHFEYMGIVVISDDRRKDPILRYTKRSFTRDPNWEPFRVLQWTLKVIWQVARGDYTLPPQYEILHDGKCGRCGAKLTHPESLRTGLGPDCAVQMGVPYSKRAVTYSLLDELPEPIEYTGGGR